MGCKAIDMTVMALVCAFLFAAWVAPVLAQDTSEKTAREIADHIMRQGKQSSHPELGDWSRSVLERALERAGKNASKTPSSLPAESRAGSFAGNLLTPQRGPEVIVFMSLSVPPSVWREWNTEAGKIDAPLVLRGVTKGGLRATVKRVGTLLTKNTGAAVDPRLFRLFEIDAVPAVVVVPGGVPPCKRRGCSGDPPPPHDLVSGNVGLGAALQIIADEGGPARDAARRHLARLRGESR